MVLRCGLRQGSFAARLIGASRARWILTGVNCQHAAAKRLECGHRIRELLDWIIVVLATAGRIGDGFREQFSNVLGQMLVRQEDGVVGQVYRDIGLEGRSDRRSPFKKTETE